MMTPLVYHYQFKLDSRSCNICINGWLCINSEILTRSGPVLSLETAHPQLFVILTATSCHALRILWCHLMCARQLPISAFAGAVGDRAILYQTTGKATALPHRPQLNVQAHTNEP